MPPNSTEVYRLLGKALAPWAALNGFVKDKRAGRWSKPVTEGELSLAFQCDKHGPDAAGGRFTLNLELSNLGARVCHERFGQILDSPPDRQAFAEIAGAEDHRFDPWFQYVTPSDIERWWRDFLEPRMSRMVERFLHGDALPPAVPRKAVASVSIRNAARGSLLLVFGSPAARALAAVLRELDAGGCVVDSGKAEYLFFLGPQTGLTT
jgi:hypothetical protein